MIIFPMLGRSKRFSDAGYTLPKYMLEVAGKSILLHIIENFLKLENLNDIIFVYSNDDFVRNFILQETCKANILKEHVKLVPVSGATLGQADTVLRGIDGANVSDDQAIWIFNIDTIRLPVSLPSSDVLSKMHGYLEVFEGEGDHWSFARLSDEEFFLENRISCAVEVAEKRRISNFCSDGLYFFNKAGIFRKYVQKAITSLTDNNEIYVAPIYQEMINDGLLVGCGLIDKGSLHFSGTPSEYRKLVEQEIPAGLIASDEYATAKLDNKIWRIFEQGARQNEFLQLISILNDSLNLINSKKIKLSLRSYFSMLSNYERMSIYFKILIDFHNRNNKIYKKLFAFLSDLIILNFKDSKLNSANVTVRANYMIALALMNDYKVNVQFYEDVREIISEFDDRMMWAGPLGRIINISFRRKERFFDSLINNPPAPKNISSAFLNFLLILSSNKGNINSLLDKLKLSIFQLGVSSSVDAARVNLIQGYSPSDYLNENLTKKFNNKTPTELEIIVSGQIRNDNFVVDFIKNIRNKQKTNISLSTWKNRGVPPVRDALFRGYEESIRTKLYNACHKNNVTMKNFEDLYHIKEFESVNYFDLCERYGTEDVLIDVEDDVEVIFSSNQQKMFYKLRSVYNLAVQKRDPSVFIRIRPDLDFNVDLESVFDAIECCKTNQNVIFLPRFPLIDFQFPFVDDNFAIAGRRAMAVYASFFDAACMGVLKPIILDKDAGIKPHSSLANWLLFNNVEIKFIDYSLNKYAECNPIKKEDYRIYIQKLINQQGPKKILNDLLAATF